MNVRWRLNTQLSISKSLPRLISGFLPSCQNVRSPILSPLLSAIQARYASHKSQSSALNGSGRSAGKRLGAKKMGGDLVVPGVIIYRQRGTKWFPGENTDMGRDHTIFATEKGYVRYYKDPSKHTKRRYIGVVFEKDQELPTSPQAPRIRRFGMLATPLRTPGDEIVPNTPSKNLNLHAHKLIPVVGKTKSGQLLPMRRDFSFRQKKTDFGKIMDEAAKKLRPLIPRDRWLIWKKQQEKANRVKGTTIVASSKRVSNRKDNKKDKKKKSIK